MLRDGCAVHVVLIITERCDVAGWLCGKCGPDSFNTGNTNNTNTTDVGRAFASKPRQGRAPEACAALPHLQVEGRLKQQRKRSVQLAELVEVN